MTLKTAISVKNLTKRFGDFTAVDKINFEVRTGEIFGFLGPNGAGKTTAIRMALGLLKPTSGQVNVLGIPMDKRAAELRPRAGYMSQRFSLYNDLTVLQNLEFYGRAYGLKNNLLQERIVDALTASDLLGRENAKTKDLSGGWRQRLALSAAILHRPEIIFLDEPTAGVDPVSRRAFWDLLYKLVAEGITVFVTTHYMDEAEHCHRLAFIQRGKIIAYGTPAEIKANVMRSRVLEIAPSNAALAVKALRAAQAESRLDVDEVELYGALVHVIANDPAKVRRAIRKELKQAGLQPGEMSLVEPSLEDVFISAMKA